MTTVLRIGTRGSKLALAQAEEVKARLLAVRPELVITIVPIKTTGDAILHQNLTEIGGKGLFTKEIEEALLGGDVDIAVHSMKDVPAFSPAGLVIDCHLPRENPRDAFISKKYKTLQDMPAGSVVGTSSSRRLAAIKTIRPDLTIVPFRGNVLTRLQKLEDGVADATILAVAGLNRLGMKDVITSIIDDNLLLPAVAQGAIGIQRCEGDQQIAALLALLHDAETGICVAAERGFLERLEGSCRTPIAAFAVREGDGIYLRATITAPDGSVVYHTEKRGPIADAARLGHDAAEELLARGARLC